MLIETDQKHSEIDLKRALDISHAAATAPAAQQKNTKCAVGISL